MVLLCPEFKDYLICLFSVMSSWYLSATQSNVLSLLAAPYLLSPMVMFNICHFFFCISLLISSTGFVSLFLFMAPSHVVTDSFTPPPQFESVILYLFTLYTVGLQCFNVGVLTAHLFGCIKLYLCAV